MFSVLLAVAAATAPIPDTFIDWWSDYYDTPAKGLSKGELSVVVAEITVNKRGYFENCVGGVFAGNPKMGPYVCKRLKMRGMFKPARASDGSKAFGVYRKLIIVANINQRTYFRMPHFGIGIPGPGPAVSDDPFEIQFQVAADGRISDCSLVESVGINLERHKQVIDPSLVQRACAQVPVQLKPAPARDRKGNLVLSVQNALVSTERQVLPRNQ